MNCYTFVIRAKVRGRVVAENADEAEKIISRVANSFYTSQPSITAWVSTDGVPMELYIDFDSE